MKPYDVVQIAKLGSQARSDAWKINERAPRVGDSGTIVEVNQMEGQPDSYIVECVDEDGHTVWLAEFSSDELRLQTGGDQGSPD